MQIIKQFCAGFNDDYYKLLQGGPELKPERESSNPVLSYLHDLKSKAVSIVGSEPRLLLGVLWESSVSCMTGR